MNPVITLKRVIKSKPVVDQLEGEVKQMNPTNWRTTVHGVVIGLLMLASIWAPAEYQPLITKTSMAFVAMGLFTSADAANMGK
jgi:hypothetical protein